MCCVALRRPAPSSPCQIRERPVSWSATPPPDPPASPARAERLSLGSGAGAIASVEAFVVEGVFGLLAFAPVFAAIGLVAPEADPVFGGAALVFGALALLLVLVEIDDHRFRRLSLRVGLGRGTWWHIVTK